MFKRSRVSFAVIVPALAVAAGLLTGCPSPEPQAAAGGPGSAPAPGSSPGPGGPGGGQQLTAEASGAEIFQAKCQGCHGAQGEGGSGPSIKGEAGEPVAELRNVIENGHGKMPAFKGQLTSEQIDKVAAHVKTLGG